MKVTKIIREYIEDSINAKFQPYFDALSEKYNVKPARDAVEEARKKAEAAARKILEPVVRQYYTEESILGIFNEARPLVVIPYGGLKALRNLGKAEDRLHKMKLDAIKNILVSLELGGTKDDLDRLLAAVNPPSIEEEE